MGWKICSSCPTFRNGVDVKTVLLTGGNGFIGSHCLKPLLNRGYKVHALSRQLDGMSPNGVIWHKIDLLQDSFSSVIQTIAPTHLLHLAWCTTHGEFWSSPLNRLWFETSLELLKKFYECGGTRFVFAGSCAEYTWNNLTCIENKSSEIPTSIYGQYKKNFSDWTHLFSKENNISVACGRVFFLYGPGEPQSRLIPSIIRKLLKGEIAKCSDGNQIRDFMHVVDVADALVTLLDSPVEGVVNIASGEPIKLRTLVEEIANLMNKRDQILFGEIPRAAYDPDDITASTERLMRELNYSPKIPLKEGLLDTIAHLKSVLDLKSCH